LSGSYGCIGECSYFEVYPMFNGKPMYIAKDLSWRGQVVCENVGSNILNILQLGEIISGYDIHVTDGSTDV